MLLLLIALLPISARADIYKCSKGGTTTYQDAPCEDSDVQATHVDAPGSSHFVGCFASSTGNNYGSSVEVRANGAGTYQMIDEHNPLAGGVTLRAATNEELKSVSDGLHIQITEGLSRDTGRPALVNVYSVRTGYQYVVRTTPTAVAISPSSLYGIYRGTSAEGQAITLLYRGGGVPELVIKGSCPTY
ncbi:DUF4124 domain-containing protein [Dyella flava]|uniref:DUF4124 domain-containing protein n=1 Tax=Dyella flava TaxID=1920170 RepID=A0ABS2K1V5_9GAMM|nr:DUF4124 domain-containing protein [Dyella flava]MBM7125204.1 DUF4124 domain-containing protein [Dyella flava]GLQ52077.1 hypothetical protein GCM10010872_35260 [Dyella flava]